MLAFAEHLSQGLAREVDGSTWLASLILAFLHHVERSLETTSLSEDL